MSVHMPASLSGGLLALLAAAAVATPPDPAAGRLAEAILRAQALPSGTRGPLLNAFVDAHCAACALLERRLRPLIRRGQLRVRWIPVQLAGDMPPADEAVRANTALLRLLTGTVATPTLAYRGADGALRVQVGAPPDLAGLLREAR